MTKHFFLLSFVFAGLAGAQTSSTGSVLVEDWSSVRKNASSNPAWVCPYNGCSCSVSGSQMVNSCSGGQDLISQGGDGNYGKWTSPCTIANGCTYIQGFAKSGTFTPSVNRLRWRMKCPTSSSGAMEIGTYIAGHGDTGGTSHYYHQLNPTFYSGQWAYFTINQTPQHQVSDSGGAMYPPDPSWNTPSGTPVHYMDGLTSWYIDGSLGSIPSGACTYDAVYFDTVSGEPDAYVATVETTYNSGTNKAEVNWAAPKNVPGGESYQVRYSTSGSLKSAGFNSGVDGGSVRGPDSSGYVNTRWTSGAFSSQPARVWVAIRPNVAVASVTGGTPLKLTFQSPYYHPFTTGETVSIANVCAAVNGTHTVTVVDNLSVTVDGASGSCSYGGLGNGTATSLNNTNGFTEVLLGDSTGTSPAPPPTSSSTCDFNGDGVLNSADYDAAVSAALGKQSCPADLDGDGICTVVEVQRVVNAISGGGCRVGQ
jgi:hypothetical protein